MLPLRILALSALVLSCAPGHAVRPADPTFASASGRAQTCSSHGSADPLVVDLPPEARGDLEQGMSQHVMVVSYDCKSLKLLPDCEVVGTYQYAGFTPKEQVISIADKDEIHATLPATGLALAANLGVERTASLDIALMMVGRLTSTRRSVPRVELAGRCEGATHFVRRATLGAFAMATGTRGEVKAAATIFGSAGGAAAGGSSASARTVKNTDGTLEACRSAHPDAKARTAGCASPLRLELLPVDAERTDGRASATELVTDAPACPDGFVLSEGRCAKPSSPGDRNHLCAPNDKADCAEQCRRGQAGSCNHLGALLSPSPSALTYFKKACDANYDAGCFNLGISVEQGYGVPPDFQRAAPLYVKACSLGSGGACGNLGAMRRSGLGGPVDKREAARLFERGCDLGAARPLSPLGVMLFHGEEIPRDPSRGESYLLRACDGGDGGGCDQLGVRYSHADGRPKDPARALQLFQRACRLRHPGGCNNLGTMLQSGKHGVPAEKAKAKEAFDAACSLRNAEGCGWAGIMTVAGDGIARDLRAGTQYLEKGCKGGHAQSCTLLKQQ